ncbi:MAG: radical SAM protein [Candidatus Omnitrophota bacterium]|nr:radical SAM protein [Candidatus Omnitrophota bacterium]
MSKPKIYLENKAPRANPSTLLRMVRRNGERPSTTLRTALSERSKSNGRSRTKAHGFSHTLRGEEPIPAISSEKSLSRPNVGAGHVCGSSDTIIGAVLSRRDKIKVLNEKVKIFYKRLEKCDLCPRNCKVNRLKGHLGYCGIGKDIILYAAFLHKGEEPPISGKAGSGTIFFSGCNLKCIFCQNHKFSHVLQGKIIKEKELAALMLRLQDKGAHNINLVTPTHVLPQLLKSLLIASGKGLVIPIVYNTSGYEKVGVVEDIGEIVDVYLADMKYTTGLLAKKYSNASDYPLFNQESIKRMYMQKKKASFHGSLLEKGLIIRHLVLPSYIEESKKVISWIRKHTPQAFVSVMFQYQPYFKANGYPEINRRINNTEYQEIKDFIETIGLEGWVQDLTPKEELAGVYFDTFGGA